MADPREVARATLAQTDEDLAADCDWKHVARRGGPTRLRLVHRPTRLRVEVEARETDAQTRFIALLYLRNRCYDILRAHVRPKK